MSAVQNEQIMEETVGHVSAPQEESIAASLGINGQLFVFQLVNFTIVLGIVWFLILKPLTKKMDERKKLIDESLDKAKEIETNHIMSQQKYQEKIDEAKIEANKVIEQASLSAEKVGESLRVKSKQEIEMLIEQAKKSIEQERVQMREEIRQETADMIISALRRVVGEKMSKELDEDYIQSIVQQQK